MFILKQIVYIVLVNITFTPRITGKFARVATYFDDTLETGGNITINQDSYTAALDRVYEVKGRKNIHAEIENTGNTNGLTYRIEKARIEFRNLSDLDDADFNQIIKADTDVLAAVAASGTVTLVGVLADDTVTVNNLVYTAVTGAKANNAEFSIDGTDTVDAADLADSITNDTRQGTLDDLTAANVLGVVTITQTVTGTGGNATTLVSSNGSRLAVSGATFTGGINNIGIDDVVDISPETTAIRVRVRRQSAGQNTTRQGIVSVN